MYQLLTQLAFLLILALSAWALTEAVRNRAWEPTQTESEEGEDKYDSVPWHRTDDGRCVIIVDPDYMHHFSQVYGRGTKDFGLKGAVFIEQEQTLRISRAGTEAE